MPKPLYVTQQDPVDLVGSLDANREFQLSHGNDKIVDHEQTLHVEHRDLADSNGTVRIRLQDFTSGSQHWRVAVNHEFGDSVVSWAREGNHVYHDFGPMTSEQLVDVVATNNGIPAETKKLRIRLKTSPTDAQPDRRWR